MKPILRQRQNPAPSVPPLCLSAFVPVATNAAHRDVPNVFTPAIDENQPAMNITEAQPTGVDNNIVIQPHPEPATADDPAIERRDIAIVDDANEPAAPVDAAAAVAAAVADVINARPNAPIIPGVANMPQPPRQVPVAEEANDGTEAMVPAMAAASADDQPHTDEAVRPRKYSRTIPLPIPVPDNSQASTSQASISATRPNSASDRPPSGPRMTTRRRAQEQKRREDEIRDSHNRIRSTVESVTRRTRSVESPNRESLPDVFAPFSSADLIRNDIADMRVFDELESEVFADEANIETITLSDATYEKEDQQPSTSAQANQPANLLQPFRNFLDSFTGAGPSLPAPNEASTPKD